MQSSSDFRATVHAFGVVSSAAMRRPSPGRAEPGSQTIRSPDYNQGTTAVAVVIDIVTGEVKTLVAINGDRPMPKSWEGVIRDGEEEFIRGTKPRQHAEDALAEAIHGRYKLIGGASVTSAGLKLVVGTSRVICHQCKATLDGLDETGQLAGKQFRPGNLTKSTRYRGYIVGLE